MIRYDLYFYLNMLMAALLFVDRNNQKMHLLENITVERLNCVNATISLTGYTVGYIYWFT